MDNEDIRTEEVEEQTDDVETVEEPAPEEPQTDELAELRVSISEIQAILASLVDTVAQFVENGAVISEVSTPNPEVPEEVDDFMTIEELDLSM